MDKSSPPLPQQGGEPSDREVFSIADAHATESGEDGSRIFDRGGLLAFAADLAAVLPQVGEAEATLAQARELLQDSNVVHASMLSGSIAKIGMRECAHVHGSDMVTRWNAFEQWEQDRICKYCDDTGYIHDIAGEFRGACNCEVAKENAQSGSAPASLGEAKAVAPEEPPTIITSEFTQKDAAYDLIDRYLRNNMMDDDYAEYSGALELIYAAPIAQALPVAAESTKALTDSVIAEIYHSSANQPLRPQDRALAIPFAHAIERHLSKPVEMDRNAFEAWIKSFVDSVYGVPHDMSRIENEFGDSYTDVFTTGAWCAWQYISRQPTLAKDMQRLDYLQEKGATVEITFGLEANWQFRVAGIYAATDSNIRKAIDIAITVMQEGKTL